MRRFKQATAVALSAAMVMTSVFTTNVSAGAKTKKHNYQAVNTSRYRERQDLLAQFTKKRNDYYNSKLIK